MAGAALEDPTLYGFQLRRTLGHQVSVGSWVQVGPVCGVMTDGARLSLNRSMRLFYQLRFANLVGGSQR